MIRGAHIGHQLRSYRLGPLDGSPELRPQLLLLVPLPPLAVAQLLLLPPRLLLLLQLRLLFLLQPRGPQSAA
jgi:hypothetical protein